MLNEYYDRRGWTEDGVPKAETLDRLDVKDFVPANVEPNV